MVRLLRESDSIKECRRVFSAIPYGTNRNLIRLHLGLPDGLAICEINLDLPPPRPEPVDPSASPYPSIPLPHPKSTSPLTRGSRAFNRPGPAKRSSPMDLSSILIFPPEYPDTTPIPLKGVSTTAPTSLDALTMTSASVSGSGAGVAPTANSYVPLRDEALNALRMVREFLNGRTSLSGPEYAEAQWHENMRSIEAILMVRNAPPVGGVASSTTSSSTNRRASSSGNGDEPSSLPLAGPTGGIAHHHHQSPFPPPLQPQLHVLTPRHGSPVSGMFTTGGSSSKTPPVSAEYRGEGGDIGVGGDSNDIAPVGRSRRTLKRLASTMLGPVATKRQFLVPPGSNGDESLSWKY